MGMLTVELPRFGSGRTESWVPDRDDCDITDLRALAP